MQENEGYANRYRVCERSSGKNRQPCTNVNNQLLIRAITV